MTLRPNDEVRNRLPGLARKMGLRPANPGLNLKPGRGANVIGRAETFGLIPPKRGWANAIGGRAIGRDGADIPRICANPAALVASPRSASTTSRFMRTFYSSRLKRTIRYCPVIPAKMAYRLLRIGLRSSEQKIKQQWNARSFGFYSRF